MFISHFKSQRGSTLVMVLVTMTILSLLGSVILSATLMGLKMKENNNSSKTALYLSEAGLEEAYALVGAEVEKAVIQARSEAIVDLKNYETAHPELKWHKEDYQDKLNAFYVSNYIGYFYNEDGSVAGNLSTLLTKLNEVHNYQAGQDVLTGKHGERIISVAADLQDPQDSSIDDPFDLSNAIVDGGVNPDETMTIYFRTVGLAKQLNSNADAVNNLGKKEQIDSQIVIGIPDYDIPHYQTRPAIYRNALWDKALTAEGNIYVLGDQVAVNGNIYAYGQNDVADELAAAANTNGIIVGDGDKSGSLQVTGDVVTEKYLQTRADGSEITIRKFDAGHGGNVYCNSLVTQAGTGSTSYTDDKITIDGSVSTLDDIEMDASQSNIWIKGSYFGFSNGNTAGFEHNQSSSIVINSDDIDSNLADRSQIKIDGDGSSKSFPSGASLPAGVYIAGTVYVEQPRTINTTPIAMPTHGTVVILPDGHYTYTKNSADVADTDQFTVNITTYSITAPFTEMLSGISGETKVFGFIKPEYQTGDSVTVKGNYMGYTRTLSSASDDNYNQIGAENFKSYPPLDLVTRLKDGTEMGIVEKRQYSKFADEEADPDLKLQNSLISVAGNMQYALGAFMNGTEVQNSESQYHNFLDVQERLSKLTKEYWYQVNQMADPQHENYLGSDPQTTNYATGSTGTAAVPVSIADWFSFPDSEMRSPDGSASIHYTSNSSADIVLRGPDADVSDIPAAALAHTITLPSSGVADGIIVTQGDIYIVGAVDYTGMIAAAGDIIFVDDNRKTISNQYASAWEDNYVLSRVFSEIIDYPDETQIGDLFRQDDSWTEKLRKDDYASQVNADDGELSYMGIVDKVIKIKSWKNK